MRFDLVLTTFADFFETAHIRWALAGGLAMNAWGFTRATNDIDFVLDGAFREQTTAFAQSLGYELIHTSEGFSNLVHAERDFGKVDLLYVYAQTADRLFANATKRASAKDVSAPVLRPEHLAMMKALAMKSSPMRVLIDSPDVAFLLSLPEIDREQVRDYFTRHGLLELFDAIDRHRS